MNFDDQRKLQQRQNPMNTHVMLDLETLGSKPGSAIIAIGAVKFDGDRITSEFYRRIDVESCVQCGLVVDVATILWWFKQEDAARLELCKPADPLPGVLIAFQEWLADPGVKVWGNGAAFDNTLLASAYATCQLAAPWKFYNDRCYRTMKALRPSLMPPKAGTKHNALDDARAQALHLMELLHETDSRIVLA